MPASQLLSRLLLAIPTLFGVALIVFVLLRVVPGDPIAMMIGPGATEETIAALRANGVEFFVEPMSSAPGVRVAFVSGPDNVKVEVLGITTDSRD